MVYSRVVDPTAEVHGKREGRALHTSSTPQRHSGVASDGGPISDARTSSPTRVPVSNTTNHDPVSTATGSSCSRDVETAAARPPLPPPSSTADLPSPSATRSSRGTMTSSVPASQVVAPPRQCSPHRFDDVSRGTDAGSSSLPLEAGRRSCGRTRDGWFHGERRPLVSIPPSRRKTATYPGPDLHQQLRGDHQVLRPCEFRVKPHQSHRNITRDASRRMGRDKSVGTPRALPQTITGLH